MQNKSALRSDIAVKIHSIKFNFLMNAATTVLNFLFPLITFPYVSRVLLPTGYGAAELALNTAQLFALIALLGVNTYGIRECAKVRDDQEKLAKVFQELIVIIGFWSIVVTLAYYGTIICVPRFSESASVYFVAGLLIPLSVIGFQWFMSAMEQYAFMALRNIAVKIIIIIAMFLLVKSEADVIIWVALSVLATGIANITNMIYIAINLKISSWRQLNLRRHIKPLIIFFLMVAATTIYTTLDTVMLGYMTSDSEVGYYNVAIKIKNILISLVGALASVLIPRATYYIAKSKSDDYFRIVNLSVRAATIYSFFVLGAVAIFANSIINILAGEQYALSVPALILVMPAVVFVSYTQITSSEILMPKSREKDLAIIYAFAGLIDIVLNILLIPTYHAVGAAIGTTAAEGFVFFAHLIVIKRMETLKPYIKGCSKIIPCELAAFFLMILGRILLGDTFIAAAISIVVALSLLIIMLKIIHEPLVEDLAGFIKHAVYR